MGIHRYRGKPGTVTVKFDVVKAGPGVQGLTVAALRERLNGDDGYVVDPLTQTKHFVSIPALNIPDEEGHRIVIHYRFKPDQLHPSDVRA